MSKDIKIGLLPITILVRNAFKIEIGQLQAKHTSIKTSNILKLMVVIIKMLGSISKCNFSEFNI